MDVTKLIQIDIKELMVNCCCLGCEAGDIYKAYWATNANTLVAALVNGTDGATLATKLTKAEYLAGITLAEDLEDFFKNEAITQTDYVQTCNKLIYGSAASPAELSAATEEIGNRLKTLAENCFIALHSCKKVLQVYAANEIGDMIANLETHRKIPGCDLVAYELSAGITFVEQFRKFMENEVATQGDYASTVALWQGI